ncbi:MAG: phytoene/squalene synthase family protein [Verrucomicrobiia bacterium]|jgi:phytoene synthase
MSYSQTVTKKSASNLALAFCALPKERRLDMCALYAFCRVVDDIADEENTSVAERRERLRQCREDLLAVFKGEEPVLEVNKEIKPVIHKYGLAFELFDELLKGVEMDLEIRRYSTFNELDVYCYRVASVVGLLSIEVFGYKNKLCRDFAIYLGKAFQYTNILRDVKNDAQRGRIYIPAQLLEQYGVKEEEILNGFYSERYFNVASALAGRAIEYYKRASQSLPPEDKKSMIAAELMGDVYFRLLKKLREKKFNVFDEQIKLSKLAKTLIAVRAVICAGTGLSFKASYGRNEWD